MDLFGQILTARCHDGFSEPGANTRYCIDGQLWNQFDGPKTLIIFPS